MRVEQNGTKNLLVICPEKVTEQWVKVIEDNTVGARVAEFKDSWGSAKMDAYLVEHRADYEAVVINFEKIYRLTGFINTIDATWTVIIDESHRIKAMGPAKKRNKDGVKVDGRTRVTKCALEIGEKTPWKIILTATPTQGNFGGYIDYYTQLRFLGYIEMTFEAFKARYCVERMLAVPGVKWPVPTIVGYKHTDEIDEILKLSCRFYEPKFGDFEPQHIDIHIDRAPKYAHWEHERVVGDIVLTNSPRKRTAMKMLTTGVVSGFDIDNKRVVVEDNRLKIDWLESFLADTKEVVAIYYQYNVELEQLKALMKKLGKKTIIITGETKNAYREINEKTYDVMLGQYQAASQALDGLHKKCHIMMFFAMPEDSVLYRQALGRIYRDGQTHVPMYYYLLMKKTIDEDIRDMINQKIEFNRATLGLIEIDA